MMAAGNISSHGQQSLCLKGCSNKEELSNRNSHPQLCCDLTNYHTVVFYINIISCRKCTCKLIVQNTPLDNAKQMQRAILDSLATGHAGRYNTESYMIALASYDSTLMLMPACDHTQQRMQSCTVVGSMLTYSTHYNMVDNYFYIKHEQHMHMPMCQSVQ